MTAPTFTNDAIVFGILMISLGFVFFTENLKLWRLNIYCSKLK